MTIQEAIKSGRPFRRPCFGDYIGSFDNCESFRLRWVVSRENVLLNSDDLLADDWEIESEKIEVTREQLFREINAHIPVIAGGRNSRDEVMGFNDLCKALGFREDKCV